MQPSQDRNRALSDLMQLQMHPKDSITSFISKFERTVKAIGDVSMGMPLPTDQEQVHLFIQKCLEIVPEGTDLRNSLLDYQRLINHNGNNPTLPFKLREMQHALTQQENSKRRIQRPQPSSQTKHRDQENKPMQPQPRIFRKPLKCLKCNGPHKLMQCRKATAQEKKDLWEKFRAQFRRNTTTPRVRSANNTTTTNNNNQRQQKQQSTSNSSSSNKPSHQIIQHKKITQQIKPMQQQESHLAEIDEFIGHPWHKQIKHHNISLMKMIIQVNQ